MKIIRGPYTPRERFQTVIEGESLAKQSFADECDINQIMQKFQRTGIVDHVKTHGERYGFCDAVTYHDAMNITIEAQDMFADLPSSVRQSFGGDPAAFLDFVDNADAEDLRKMGLTSNKRPSKAISEEIDPPAKEPEKPPETPSEGG